MGKPDGWAKAWGLAAHVEPAGCMSGTCGVRGAQGPQMDYSKQIVPQGKGAANPSSTAPTYCERRLRDVYYGDYVRMGLEDELCGTARGADLPPGVTQGVPVTQPAADGVIRFALARPYSGRIGYGWEEPAFPYASVDGRLFSWGDLSSSNPTFSISVSPGVHQVSSGIQVSSTRDYVVTRSVTASTASISVSVPSGGAVDVLIDNNALQPPRVVGGQSVASFAPRYATLAPANPRENPIPDTSKNFRPAKGVWYR